MFHWSYSCLLQKQQNHQYLGQFLRSINTMQTYGQSCLYLHICLSFLIITTAVSLEKNIPCSKSHLDLIGRVCFITRWWNNTRMASQAHCKSSWKTRHWEHPEQPKHREKIQSVLPQQISSMRTRNMLQCGTSQSTATSWRCPKRKRFLEGFHPRTPSTSINTRTDTSSIYLPHFSEPNRESLSHL